MPPETKPDAFAALHYPEFLAYALGSFLLTVAALVQEVVVGFELYRRTHDPLVLGLIGLAEGLPYIGLSLFGGHFADRRAKKPLILGSLGLILAAAVGLWAVMRHPGLEGLSLELPVYGLIALIGFGRGVLSPAVSSLKAFLLPRALYSNGSTWSSAAWQAGSVLGPAAGGLLYAGFGLSVTLLLGAAMLAGAFLCHVFIKGRPPVERGESHVNIWASLAEGIRFVKDSPLMLYSISLDLVAVLFGGMVAILPVFATDILHVGPKGLGVMRAVPSVGALLTLLFTAWFPPTRQAWRNLLLAVAGFGVATIVFGFSKIFWLSLVALFFTGVFDSVSVVVRQTIAQVVPPDALRGRVTAVNGVFVSASNEIGAFESGIAAKAFGAVHSVIGGGVLTVVLAAVVWRRTRWLLGVDVERYDPANPPRKPGAKAVAGPFDEKLPGA